MLRIVWDLPEASDLSDDIVVRRSTAPPGETLAGVVLCERGAGDERPADDYRGASMPSAAWRERRSPDERRRTGRHRAVRNSTAERRVSAASLVHVSAVLFELTAGVFFFFFFFFFFFW